MKKKYLQFLVFGFCLLVGNNVFAQKPKVTKTLNTTPAITQDTIPERKQVIVDRSDLAEGIVKDGKEIRYLKGQVELRQGDVYMYCDSATIINNNVFAKGKVIIQQSDTLNIFADSLAYEGDSRIANLYGDVRMDNQGQQLFTDHLYYDLKNKIAKYYTRSLLTNDSTYVQSNRGIYYVQEDQAQFRDSVVVIDPNFTLRSDSLDFSTETKVLTFIAPTLITQNGARIYCERGFYDTEEEYAEFLQNAQYSKEDQQATAYLIIYDGKLDEVILKGNAQFVDKDKNATADVIRYQEKTEVTILEGNAKFKDATQEVEGEFIRYDTKNEMFDTKGRSRIVDGNNILDADTVTYVGALGKATGNVVWTDTVDQIIIESERMDYNKDTDYIKASGGRPLMISVVDDDTLFMRSDTLISFMKNPQDSIRTLLGYQRVRIYKSNLQVVCDSLSYSMGDSLFRFYYDPIIWSDTSQFYADTVFMQMANEKIDKINLVNNAYIINSPDEIYFNQIKGKNITAHFKEDELRKMFVNGNAESVYYARNEEDAYTGVNKCICSRMMINFTDNEIDNIYFYNNPKSNMYPMRKADHNGLKLPGFRWDSGERPRSVADLNKVGPKKVRRWNRPLTIPDSTLVDSLAGLPEKPGARPRGSRQKLKPGGKDAGNTKEEQLPPPAGSVDDPVVPKIKKD